MLSWNSNQVWSGQGFVPLKLWLISQVCLEELLLMCDEAPSIFQTWFHMGGGIRSKSHRKGSPDKLAQQLNDSDFNPEICLQQTAFFDPSWDFNGIRPALHNQSASFLLRIQRREVRGRVATASSCSEKAQKKKLLRVVNNGCRQRDLLGCWNSSSLLRTGGRF